LHNLPPTQFDQPITNSRQTLSKPEERFDLLIAADCLWLHDEHTNLLNTLTSSLSQDGQAFFTTGHYAKRPYVDEFFRRVEKLGFSVEELDIVPRWEGTMEVDLGPGRLKEDLDLKKAAVWAFKVRRE
jgi:predicted nicotinamide N-methyase